MGKFKQDKKTGRIVRTGMTVAEKTITLRLPKELDDWVRSQDDKPSMVIRECIRQVMEKNHEQN